MKILHAPYRLIALLLLFCANTPLSAQSDVARSYYSRLSKFRIPFQVDPGDRKVVDVVLHVSEDLGRSYQRYARAIPSDNGFNFTARRDGWYWFIVQTIDEDGNRYPLNVEREQPGLKVNVDTITPKIVLKQGRATGKNVRVEWDIQDETLDLKTLNLEYRARGGVWRTELVEEKASGAATWNPGSNDVIEVKLEVKDKAGNIGVARTEVQQDIQGGVGWGGSGDNTNTRRELETIQKVNSKTIRLNYRTEDVGPSGLSTIEVWMTKGGSRKWERYPQDANTKPPYDITVKDEGLYGFTLIARSGVGLALRPPEAGDRPDIWVEVDITKPVVKLDKPFVGQGQDTGKLSISWTANDKNMSRQPITIFYREKSVDHWIEVPGAINLPNTGRYVWHMQSNVPYQFALKVEAKDEAGNIGMDETIESVKVDLARPKVRVIGVQPAQP